MKIIFTNSKFRKYQNDVFRKLFMLLLIMLICKFGFTQVKPVFESSKTYSDTVTISSSKLELYLRAKQYFAKTTAVTQNSVKFDDKELGKIISQSTATNIRDVGGMGAVVFRMVVKYTTTLIVKDNKYMFILSDIFYDHNSVTDAKANAMLQQVEVDIKAAMLTESISNF